MSAPNTIACARWLIGHLGAHLILLDHPGLPECAGAHRPDRPCDGQRGKHPCGRWSRDSTNDVDLVTAALIRTGLRNLGIDCGKSGLLVIDEDRRGAFGAFASSTGQQIPVTFAVETGKGTHYYLQQPPGQPLGNSPGAMAGRGVDVRGAGGFVVAPGSVHASGVVYRPVDSTVPVAAAPDWLVTALRSPRPSAVRPQSATPGAPVNARLRGIVATVLDAQPGERNNTLHWASCRFAELISEGQVDHTTAVDILTRAGEAAGLASGEVAATVASGLRLVSA